MTSKRWLQLDGSRIFAIVLFIACVSIVLTCGYLGNRNDKTCEAACPVGTEANVTGSLAGGPVCECTITDIEVVKTWTIKELRKKER